MTAILDRVHEVLAAAGHDADDLDPALEACVRHSLRGPYLAVVAAPRRKSRSETLIAAGLLRTMPLSAHQGP